jgi:hypothetical protein
MTPPRNRCFCITDENGRSHVLSCTSERIKEIERSSVVLGRRIKNHGQCEGECGGIPLKTDDDADISFDALRYLVEALPLSPRTDVGPVKANDLSEHCNAFWKYQWKPEPESASILWEHLDNSGLETQSQYGTASGSCWKQLSSIETQKESLYLINIATVYGLDDSLRERMDRVLREQIETAVWNSNSGDLLKTSVTFLNVKSCKT